KTFRMIPLPEKPKQEPEEVKPVLSETIKPAEVAKPAPQSKIFEKPAETLPVSSAAMASEFSKRESLGKRYLLDEVYFDQSSAGIRDEEVQQLNELAATLKSNQNLVVEIVGYTDNVGDPRLNVGLSQ